MMKFETDDAAGVIEFDVEGVVTTAEYDAAIPVMEAMMASHGKIAAVIVIRDFKGAELGAMWRDMTWGIGHLSKLGRAAVVTDSGWMGTITRASSHLIPSEMRLFALAELDAARAWVRGG